MKNKISYLFAVFFTSRDVETKYLSLTRKDNRMKPVSGLPQT